MPTEFAKYLLKSRKVDPPPAFRVVVEVLVRGKDLNDPALDTALAAFRSVGRAQIVEAEKLAYGDMKRTVLDEQEEPAP